MKNFYVYGYFDPRTDVCFYVGKGQGARAWVHLNFASNRRRKTHFYHKLSSLLREGVVPKVIFLSVGLTEQEAFDTECRLIASMGRIDLGTGPLCNHTNGGDGRSGYSGSERQRLAVAATGRSLGRAIIAIDPEAGTVQRQFPSQNEATRHGFHQAAICRCLSGKQKTHRGYVWRYA